MKMRKLVLVTAFLGAAFAFGDRLDGVFSGSGKPGEEYAAPLLSNGELNVPVHLNCRSAADGIFWQARRDGHKLRKLLRQGHFLTDFRIDGKRVGTLNEWEQQLDIRNAVVHCSDRLRDGIAFSASSFVPFEDNVIVHRQTIRNTDAKPHTVAVMMLYGRPRAACMPGAWTDNPAEGYAQYSWDSHGMYSWKSRTTLHARGAGTAEVVVDNENTHGLKKTFTLKPGEEQTFEWLIHFTDTLENEMCKAKVFTGVGLDAQRQPTDLDAEVTRVAQAFRARGYDGYYQVHTNDWTQFYAQSRVSFPDPELQRLAEMAAYHLRCNATKWSFPVGIRNKYWEGFYFGFDEMYCHHGLISANHIDTAKRCPLFRKATLKAAMGRQSHYGRKGKYGARYMWQSEETGEIEMSSNGFWLDHIFHMSNIAKSAWLQYLYSGDLDYLKETGYPVLLECARFFQNCATYRDSNGDTYIGKYTDLERLGTARNHPFMTTCGAIYSMRIAAEAAELLGQDLDEAAGFRRTADDLFAYLPKRDGRYVAYTDCKEESVATLSGFFPYPIIPSTNDVQRAAVKHFFENGRSAGNMYPLGKEVSPWYAGWMSATSSYMEDGEEAIRWIKEVFSVAGVFGEYYEINEEKLRKHPWFSTASGTCLFALNQLYVCDAEDETRLAFTIPTDWKDYAFTLPCQRGVMIDCAVKGGKLEKLNLSLQPKATPREVVIVLRPELAKQVKADDPAISKVEGLPTKTRFTVRVKGDTALGVQGR